MSSPAPSMKPAIVVHGGAWAIPDFLAEASIAGVQEAAKRGYKILESGGSALDAVGAAIELLEDDPSFDAGTGSVLTADGKVEMDAIIMEGRNLDTGAVCCVQNIKHPSQLARHVMDKTQHVMLVGEGANAFGWQQGIQRVPMESLLTEEAKREHELYKKYKTAVNTLFSARQEVAIGHDTVGVVAVDQYGNVACTTSTGGISSKLSGRVGDSPIIGSGAYCENEIGAVSTTGYGEAILRVCLARHVTWLMKKGASAQKAAEMALTFMNHKVKGSGGCIVVDNKGNIGRHFTTERMAWAAIDRNGQLSHGLNPNEGYRQLSDNNVVSLPKSVSSPCKLPTIIVHGGAGYGNLSEDFEQAHYKGVKIASKLGMAVLQKGGTSMDAVIEAVKFFEDDPYFNAGVGSKLTSAGRIEMDALVMEGSDLRAGAVSGLNCYMHPIEVARCVMEKTDHVYLAGVGANTFAQSQGFLPVDENKLITERTRQQFEALKIPANRNKRQYIEHDTVGAVAIDCYGNMATACSTGGINGKMPGRVGDSPFIGGSSYCDNTVGAVTATGHGECMAKVCIGKHIMELMEEGESAQSSADIALDFMTTRLNLQGRLHDYGAGAIVLGKNGDIGVASNSGKISYAYIRGNELHYGMDSSENEVESV